MPTIYLDGIQLQEDSKRLVVNAMGPLTHSCTYCGGSFIEVKRGFFFVPAKVPPSYFIGAQVAGSPAALVKTFLESGTGGLWQRYQNRANQFRGYWITKAFIDR